MKNKKRLDVRVMELYPQYSRAQIQGWIMRGEVLVEGKPVVKAGAQVDDIVSVELRAQPPKYVSRAGYKLVGLLDAFAIDVRDKVFVDAGLSTGGFSDCLLQRGAKKIYGIDVGYGQVHEKIRTDPRVIVMERTNLRNVTDIGEKVDGVSLDLSFISLTKVVDNVRSLIKPGGMLLLLIKPQFESERHEVGGGGIVRDAAVHARGVDQVRTVYESAGFAWQGNIESPITGTDGNKEFLMYMIAKNLG